MEQSLQYFYDYNYTSVKRLWSLMSRIKTVTAEVHYFHHLLQDEIALPELCDINEHALEKMLDKIYRYEKRCAVKKQKYSSKLCFQLRTRLADLLLLNDNFDLQAIIAKRSSEPENIEFVA